MSLIFFGSYRTSGPKKKESHSRASMHLINYIATLGIDSMTHQTTQNEFQWPTNNLKICISDIELIIN